jgi:alginate O-acetyltransferase complex protein AlgI
MIPGSYDFLLFVVVASFLLYTISSKTSKNSYWLLIVNLVYIATFGVNHLFSIVALGLITYLFAIGQRLSRKIFLFIGIVFNLIALLLLQLNFQQSEIESVIKYLIPIGLSFIVFRNISFLVEWDTNRVSFLRYLNYITFFPTITSGPIVKIQDFVPKKEPISNHDFYNAIIRILLGLFKKLVIATYISNNLVLQTFQLSDGVNPLVILLAVYGFAIQIYADFSGYTDIAIGVSRILGYKVNENFDAPYLAASFREFWQRWHITLSEWLKTYVYFPLGGNRLGKFREVLNTFIVMFLSAMWHGMSINFLIWGSIHGFGMIIEKLIKFEFLNKNLRRIITFHLICFSWIFFNIESFEYAKEFIVNLVDLPKVLALDINIDLNVIGLILLAWWIHNNSEAIIKKISLSTIQLRFPFKTLFVGIVLLIIFWFGPDTVPNFIYYNF